MKICEIEDGTKIMVSNEEQSVMQKIKDFAMIESFNEREQYIIDSLIKKSLVTRVSRNNSYLVVKND